MNIFIEYNVTFSDLQILLYKNETKRMKIFLFY